jgi:hypothetical protein
MAILSHKGSYGVDELKTHPELARLASPAHQAYRILHVGYTALPIIAGLDKFGGYLCNWTNYLAPVFPNMIGVAPQTFMYGVGVIEIVAGLLVAAMPRLGGFVVMFWLWGIIANLLILGGYFDVALRDFGLSLGALSLGLLGLAYAHRVETPPGADDGLTAT